ncbi:MAG: hypothetical protein ABSB42_10785 [Tepidisphaeraceae bacterium]|jgi:hypothetical protein
MASEPKAIVDLAWLSAELASIAPYGISDHNLPATYPDGPDKGRPIKRPNGYFGEPTIGLFKKLVDDAYGWALSVKGGRQAPPAPPEWPDAPHSKHLWGGAYQREWEKRQRETFGYFARLADWRKARVAASDKVFAAIGVLQQHPEWSTSRIAEEVGCSTSTLTRGKRSQIFRNARATLSNPPNLPRRHKTPRGGFIDAKDNGDE